MNNINYFAPNTLTEAIEILNTQGNARILAGGTDLVAKWKKSQRPDMTLVDIRNIPELKKIEDVPGGLFIGAGLNMTEGLSTLFRR